MTSYNVGRELSLPFNVEGIADLPFDVPPDQTNREAWQQPSGEAG